MKKIENTKSIVLVLIIIDIIAPTHKFKILFRAIQRHSSPTSVVKNGDYSAITANSR